MRIFETWRERNQLAKNPQTAQEQRAALGMDYRHVFGGEAGQRVLADILRRGGVLQDPFQATERETAYALGKRRLAVEIIEMLNSDPDAHLALLRTGETEELFPHE